VRHLVSGAFAAAWRGEENVYFFAPGMRYFRALERFLFGDTFLGYLSMVLAFPLMVFALFQRFLTPRWALVIVLASSPLRPARCSDRACSTTWWASRGFCRPVRLHPSVRCPGADRAAADRGPAGTGRVFASGRCSPRPPSAGPICCWRRA
jgi:hypothetical protein